MNFIYRLSNRETYFKLIITSRNDGEMAENYVGMYDLPIKQCYARGIYVNDSGNVTQKGLVFLCAFPGKSFNIMEMVTSVKEGETTETPNEFYVNDEHLSMNGFFEYLLSITGR